MKTSFWVAGFLLATASILAGRAQPTPTPMVGGMAVHCTDATGAPVYTIFNPQLSDAGMSSILPNGMRVIYLNSALLGQWPALMQLFTYAHECGHHASGDVYAGIVLHEDNVNREKNADRIGIRLLRDQLNISEKQAQALASVFINNPPMFPYYLPGPQRAQWILDCYRTNNDSCSQSSSTDSSSDNDEDSSDEGSGKDDSLTCTINSTSIPWNPPGTIDVRVDGHPVGSFDFGPEGSASLDFACTKGTHSFRFSVEDTVVACSGSFTVDDGDTDFSPKMRISPYGQVSCSLR